MNFLFTSLPTNAAFVISFFLVFLVFLILVKNSFDYYIYGIEKVTKKRLFITLLIFILAFILFFFIATNRLIQSEYIEEAVKNHQEEISQTLANRF